MGWPLIVTWARAWYFVVDIRDLQGGNRHKSAETNGSAQKATAVTVSDRCTTEKCIIAAGH